MAMLDAVAIGMVSLSILLMVQQSTGRFGTAGVVTGAFTAMNAVSAGVQGRLMDGYGPTRVLAPASVGSAGALVALVLLAQASASTGVLVVVAALGGLSFPQVVTAMRGLWTQLVEPRQRESAYALLSIVFEVGVISGPLVVSVALVSSSPAVALLLSAGLAAMAGLGLTRSCISGSIPNTKRNVDDMGKVRIAPDAKVKTFC
jgi:MFS family permease